MIRLHTPLLNNDVESNGMQSPQHNIELKLVLERNVIKDVVRGKLDGCDAMSDHLLALLHAILFHRLFSNIRPATKELFDVTYVYTH